MVGGVPRQALHVPGVGRRQGAGGDGVLGQLGAVGGAGVGVGVGVGEFPGGVEDSPVEVPELVERLGAAVTGLHQTGVQGLVGLFDAGAGAFGQWGGQLDEGVQPLQPGGQHGGRDGVFRVCGGTGELGDQWGGVVEVAPGLAQGVA